MSLDLYNENEGRLKGIYGIHDVPGNVCHEMLVCPRHDIGSCSVFASNTWVTHNLIYNVDSPFATRAWKDTHRDQT